MRTLSIILILILSSSCGVKKVTTERVVKDKSSNQVDAKSNEQLVKDCFDGYKSAILNDKGNVAAEFVDSRTINYYQEILEKTKSADSTEVADLNIMDKLMVLSVRHRTSKEDILKFDGKQLLTYSIQEGMVGKNSVASNEIGEVEIDDKFAKGQLVVNGMPSPAYFHFYNEDDKWKIDLTSIFPMGVVAFQQMADESGQEENEYLFMLLEMITGDQPTDKIWETIVE